MTSVKKIVTYVCYMVLGITVCYQFFALKNYSNRFIYLLLSSFALLGLVYESDFLGCSANNCSLDRNKETVEKSLGNESFACQEVKRVNWRRSFLVSFVPFIFLNGFQTTTFEMNTLTFFITLFIVYFYLNFDAHHRASVACNIEKNTN